MANNLSALYTTVLFPLALQRLVERLEGLRYIRNDISTEVMRQNETIILELNTDDFVANDFAGTTTPQDVNTNSKPIKIDTHKEVTFKLTDEELVKIQTSGLLTDVVNNAVNAIARAPLTDFYNKYKDVNNFVGDNSANPMKSNDIFDAEQKMFENLVEGQTYAGLTGKAYTQISKELKDAGTTADGIASNVLQTGELPTISDSFIFKDQLLAKLRHVAGTGTAKTLSNSSVVAVGATQITVDGVASGDTFVYGDLIEFADGQQFSVAEDVTSSGSSVVVKITTPVKVEIADATAINAIGDHDINLMYTRDFAIFAMRALTEPTTLLGLQDVNSIQNVISDPNSGVSMRVEAHRIPREKAFEWTFDILYTVQTIDPVYACRILPS